MIKVYINEVYEYKAYALQSNNIQIIADQYDLEYANYLMVD